jgi:hypothetical protein
MIYLTKEDWNNLILSKLSKEESFKQEFIELYKIHNAFNIFVRKIYVKQNEQSSIFIAAQIIFHKYRICSNFSFNKYSSEELYIFLGACLFIGQRAINILKIKIDNISFFIKQLINKKNPNIKVDTDDLNKKIIKKEYDILASIGFNIEIDSPYFFFNKLKNYLSKSELNSANFLTLLNYIIKDSFILPLSLYYTPNTITISCVKILSEKYNLKFINIKELTSLSDYQISDEEIEQCASLIGKLEDAINERKNQNNNSSNNTNNNVIKGEKDKNEDIINENTNSTKASIITKVIPSIKMNID